jgi:predicted dehydrogenase
MAVRQVRLGVIGAGLAVKVLHWPALQRLRKQFRVVSVCDIAPQAASEVAALAGLDGWTERYQEVLEDQHVEAVLISVPIQQTAEILLAAARAGKHVICEKPLGRNLEQGRELVEALRQVPAVVLIAENFHYREDIAQARRWIEEGRVGQVFMIQAWGYMWADTSAGFAVTPWRHDAQFRVSVVGDACVHHAAALRELGGEIEQVHAFVKDMHPVMAGPDTISLNVRFRSGALGHIFYTASARPADGSFANVRVLGSEGTILAGDGSATLRRPGAQDEVVRAPKFDGGYYPEFLNFYEAVVSGAPVRSTPEEALRDLTLIMRALDAAESRSVISV